MKPRCELCGRTTVTITVEFDGGRRGIRNCQLCFDRACSKRPVPPDAHPRPFNPETDLGDPLPLWWLSFADHEGFRGVVIVPGPSIRLPADSSFEGALLQQSEGLARLLGCHPGGEAVGYPVADEQADEIDDSDIARLLARDEAEALLRQVGDSTR